MSEKKDLVVKMTINSFGGKSKTFLITTPSLLDLRKKGYDCV